VYAVYLILVLLCICFPVPLNSLLVNVLHILGLNLIVSNSFEVYESYQK